MADLILVRHGQASFGQAVYDKLSPLGQRQSSLLGQWLKRCGVKPDVVASGRMERQVDTAALCLGDCGGPEQKDWLTLDGLGEYDHDTIVARFKPEWADPALLRADLAKTNHPRRVFHAMYLQAIARWTGGAFDDEYPESWTAFRARVVEGLRTLTSLEAKTIVAFTSGGPITAILQQSLGLSDVRAFDLNWPLVNAGLTTLRFSRTTGETSLCTYNSHPHLDQVGDPDLVTFR